MLRLVAGSTSNGRPSLQGSFKSGRERKKDRDGQYNPRSRPKTAEADRVAAAAKEFDQLCSATCRKRGLGLTKIQNELEAGRPPELRAACDELNDAVNACFGFPKGTWRDDRETLRRLLELNLAAEPTLPTRATSARR